MDDTVSPPMPSPTRRFPRPWVVREIDEAFCIFDGTDRPIAFVYFDPTERNPDRLTKIEARSIAHGIAHVPNFLQAEKCSDAKTEVVVHLVSGDTKGRNARQK